MASLDSIKFKWYRSSIHFDALKSELLRYFETKPCRMVRDPNSPDDKPTFAFRTIDPIPVRFGLILGDALQNLRSCLDYLVWELVLAAGNLPGNHHMFPICLTEKGYKNALRRGQVDGIDTAALALIDSLQPYLRGEDAGYKTSPLFILDNLTNINKHRHIPFTTFTSFIVSKTEPVEFDEDRWMKNSAFSMNDEANSFVRSDQVEANSQLITGLAFEDGPLTGKEITSSFNSLASFLAKEVFPGFQKFLECPRYKHPPECPIT
jgi:hypothetical protein